ncbi:MAG: YybH family protein [Isosphaeraceae bacterium]
MQAIRCSLVTAFLVMSPFLIWVRPVLGQAVPRAAPAAAAPETAQVAATSAVSGEEKPVRDLVDAFAKAYNSPDIPALAALFTDDANLVDSGGETTRGKAAIAEMYASSFEENPGLKLEPKVQEIRFLTPDVARIEGQTRLTTATGDASEFTRFSSLALRRKGKWLVAEIREYPAPAEDVSSYDRLKDLEWMVGDWVDESESVKASSNVRWADNKSFLIRTYQVEVKGEKATSGTMFIGWDPQTGQIKSWVFDAEGGHGEALWTRTGENQWVLKAQGVLRDGRPTSATQIHTVLNNDSVKTSSIDRIIGGQIAPDIVDVVMVRKPPQPGGAQSRPAAAPAQPGTGAPRN